MRNPVGIIHLCRTAMQARICVAMLATCVVTAEAQPTTVRATIPKTPAAAAFKAAPSVPARDRIDTLLVNAALTQAQWAHVSALTQIVGLAATVLAAWLAYRALVATRTQVAAALEQTGILMQQHEAEQAERYQQSMRAADDFASWLHGRLPRDSALEWSPIDSQTSSHRATAVLGSFLTSSGQRDFFLLGIEGKKLVTPIQGVACARAWVATVDAARKLSELIPLNWIEKEEVTVALDEFRVSAREMWEQVATARGEGGNPSAVTGGALLTAGDLYLAALKRANASS